MFLMHKTPQPDVPVHVQQRRWGKFVITEVFQDFRLHVKFGYSYGFAITGVNL